MPRAFDRGIPPVDKNPLISATTWGDPGTIIGEAALNAGTQIQQFLFGLFSECGEFVQGLAQFGAEFLTEVIETLTAELNGLIAAADEALGDFDEELAQSLQATIDTIRAALASPNPLVLIGTGLQAFIDSVFRLFNCPDPEDLPPALTPENLFAGLQDVIDALLDNPFVQGLKMVADLLGEAVGNFILDAIKGAGTLIEIICGLLTCNPSVLTNALTLAGHNSGLTGTTPFTIVKGITDILTPIIASPFVQGLIEFAEFLGRETGNFAVDVFQGAVGLADWFCGVLTCNPTNTGTTPITIVNAVQEWVDRIIGNPFIQGILDWVEQIGLAVGNVALDIFNGVLSIFEALCGLFTNGELPTVWGEWAATPLQIINQVVDIVEALLANPIVDGLRDLIESTGKTLLDVLLGALEFLNGAFGLLGSVLNPTAILEFLQNAIDWLWNAFSFLTGGLVDQAGKSLQDLITLFTDWIISLPLIGPLVKIFTGADGGTLDDLAEFVTKIPLVGPLVSTITGLTEADGVALDLSQLGAWAKDLLTGNTPIPAGNLFGKLPDGLLSLIPIANINVDSVNLLSQGAFATAETITGADGWSWDNTVNDPDSAIAKGSAKLTTAGVARQLYSRQAIRVGEGDKIKLSARVRTASYTGGSTSIVLSVIPYAGTTAQTEVVFATRGASNGSWVTMTGTADNRNPWVVPAGVTSLIAKIGVTSASGSGSTVWFDNIDMRKDGLLGQNLVEFLLQAWEGAWTGLVGTSGAGKIWSDLQTAAASLRGFANGTNTNLGTLSGNLLAAPASVLGSIISVVFDGTATVGSFLVQLFNALTGNTAGSATSANVATGAVAVRSTASTANTNANTAIANAATAQSTANTANSTASTANSTANTAVANAATASGRVTTTNQGLFGQDNFTTGTRIRPVSLPTSVAGIGSGIIMSKTASAPVSADWGQTGNFNFLDDDFYNVPGVTTSDLVYDNANGKVGVKALNAGWYMVELGFQLNSSVQYAYWWSFTPAVYESRTDVRKYGATVVSARDTNGFASFSLTPGYAQSSFIVYMTANDKIYPGYTAIQENNNGTGSASILRPSANTGIGGTYFSVALLNRSLA